MLGSAAIPKAKGTNGGFFCSRDVWISDRAAWEGCPNTASRIAAWTLVY